MRDVRVLGIVLILCCAGAASAAGLEGLRPHPRLLAGDARIAELRELVARDRIAKRWWSALRAEGERLLTAPPAAYQVDEGRLLDVSRRVLRRVYLSALIWRLTGDLRHAARARREVLAACAWPDWHPVHFLDTAELCHAVGIGYDWLYPTFTPEERRTVEQALMKKGLEVGLGFLEHRLPRSVTGGHDWPDRDHNWNQVCNGGLTVGALAIADVAPDLSRALVDRAVASVHRPMARYAPDGGWPEGPGYWHYGTGYNVLLIAALTSATGSDRGLSSAPGFDRTGEFPLYLTGPTRLTFNFSDSPEHELDAPELFWLARRFDHPVFSAVERGMHHEPHPLDLVWFDPAGQPPAATGLPLAHAFTGVAVATFRTSWTDPRATFVAVKGGDSRSNHSHLDLGTFVLDALGQRWALDLGPDRYALPGYFDRRGKRYGYYRLSTAGHNTLTLDGANQAADARAPLTAFDATHALLDLTTAYAPSASRVERRVTLQTGGAVLVQDEVTAARSLSIRWAMHTAARVRVDGALALLTSGGERLVARILEPPGATFTAHPVTPPLPEQPAPGVTLLSVHLAARPGPTRLRVLLSPAARPR